MIKTKNIKSILLIIFLFLTTNCSQNSAMKPEDFKNKEPRPATVEHAEWQAKMNEISHLAELLILKQRHGPTGTIMLEFEEMFTKFKDIQNN